MTDKTRQRHRLFRAPQGSLPNWFVAVLAVGLAVVGLLLQRLAD